MNQKTHAHRTKPSPATLKRHRGRIVLRLCAGQRRGVAIRLWIYQRGWRVIGWFRRRTRMLALARGQATARPQPSEA